MIAARITIQDDEQPVFEALADPTRRQLLRVLASHERMSVSDLTDYVPVTRQAVSKHLQIIEAAGLVTSEREGRERLLTFSPKPLGAAAIWMRQIESEWDARLERLRDFLTGFSDSDQPTRTDPQ